MNDYLLGYTNPLYFIGKKWRQSSMRNTYPNSTKLSFLISGTAWDKEICLSLTTWHNLMSTWWNAVYLMMRQLPWVCSRFRKGLNKDLKKELVLQEVKHLSPSIYCVQNYELATRPQFVRRLETQPTSSNPQLSGSKSLVGPHQLRPKPNNTPLSEDY